MGRKGLTIEIHVDTVDSQQDFMLPVYNTICCY